MSIKEKGKKSTYRPSKKPIYWTEGRVRAEAKKYGSIVDFRKNSYNAYQAATRNGWIKKFDWLERSTPKWTRETVMEEAKKYITQVELRDNANGAYKYALYNGMMKEFTWFIKFTPEFRRWMGTIHASVIRLLIEVGLTATKQWLYIESGKSDLYTEDQCKLLKKWSEIVTENWAAWKKLKWWCYEDMDYRKRRKKGDKEEDMDNGLHIKP